MRDSTVEKMIDATNCSVRTKLHFSYKKLKSIKNEICSGYVGDKPCGIWYSWGNIWADYLYWPEEPKYWGNKRLNKIHYVYKLKIDYSKILRLRTFSDLVKFTKKYGILVKGYNGYLYGTSACLKLCNSEKLVNLVSSTYSMPHVIDWNAVSLKYSGVDIRFNSKFHNFSYWYNPWELSSGCIWDNSALVNAVEIYRK